MARDGEPVAMVTDDERDLPRLPAPPLGRGNRDVVGVFRDPDRNGSVMRAHHPEMARPVGNGADHEQPPAPWLHRERHEPAARFPGALAAADEDPEGFVL